MTRIYFDDTNPEAVKIISDYYNFKYLIKIFYDRIKDLDLNSKFETLIITINQTFNKIDLEFIVKTFHFFINYYDNYRFGPYPSMPYNSNKQIIIIFNLIRSNGYELFVKMFETYIKNHKIFSLIT